MQIEFHPTGIFLPELDLWLDSTRDCATNWISHGHSDHARGCHGQVFGTRETLQIYRARMWGTPEREPLCCPVDLGVSWEVRGARLTAFSASHILGAAQLLVEWKNERLVYTGDIKYRRGICGNATTVVPCDRLIIESTFGLPIYRFLKRNEAKERIARFARETLADGAIPAFIGYPLGRGQEIVHVLCEAGIPTAVHGSIARFIPAYESAGYSFEGWEPYLSKQTQGKAVVVVPGFRNVLEASTKPYRLAYVSGWAAVDIARTRTGAEELIPYSDHADFDELLTLVRESGARKVDVVHGYTEMFAHVLRESGLDACSARAAAAPAVSDEVLEG